jgi:hypothetical protein
MALAQKTTLSARGEKLRINDRLTYGEIPGNDPGVHGLLMNARFIQGIFDDMTGRERYARFGADIFDPEQHTDALALALPQWYRYGLRAFTVGLQGGMPVFTIENDTIDNNPYSDDGMAVDEAYRGRLERLVAAADKIGMIVIVSLLYQGQAPRMADERVIRNAVFTACRFLRELGRSNIVVEVANEQNVGEFRRHPIVFEPAGMAELLALARTASGGLPVGCSSAGGVVFPEIAQASDIILIHGNGCTRQGYHRLVNQARAFGLNRPIVCNEDSPCIGQLAVAFNSGSSWGYYNNLTKQEPPADWSVTPGEDLFFARRMARGLGIPIKELSTAEQVVFQGFEPHMSCQGKRWLRVASEYPERIDHVEFLHEGVRVDVAYDEPFFLHHETTWIARPVDVTSTGRGKWVARIHLRSGEVVERANEIS